MTTYPQLRDREPMTPAMDRIAQQFRTRTGVADPAPEDPEARVDLEVPELLDLPEVEEPEVVKAKSKK